MELLRDLTNALSQTPEDLEDFKQYLYNGNCEENYERYLNICLRMWSTKAEVGVELHLLPAVIEIKHFDKCDNRKRYISKTNQS